MANIKQATFNSVPTGPVKPVATKIKQATFTTPNTDLYTSTSFVGNTGIGNSQFDNNIPLSQIDNLGLIRATKQPWTHQIGNALVGGIGSGVMTAIEDIGYIADIENNINRLRGIENVESNWLSDWAKDNKETLNEIMPIYRKDSSKVFDWSDSGFYYEAFKGMLDSAVGFGAVGMGAGALVKGLGTGVRALSKLGNINRLSAYTDFVVGKGLQQGALGNLSAAYITNYGESKLMALELYEDVQPKVLDELTNQFIGIHGEAPQGKQLEDLQREASDIAGAEANSFMLANKLFMLSDYAQLSTIFKTQSLSRDLLSKPGFKNWAKEQIKTAPKEALEEIGQNVLQMEGKYQAEQYLKDKFGIEVDEAISQENDWSTRMLEFATSDQALLEGMMGLLSGPIQYGITTAPFQNKTEANKRFIDQQETIKKTKDFFQNKNNIIANRTKAIETAVENGQDNVADLMETASFDQLVMENFNKGTTEVLESKLKESLESEQYTEEEKKNIQGKLDRMLSMEQEFNKSYSKYADAVNIFANRTKRKEIVEVNNALITKKEELAQNIKDEFGILIEQHNRTKQGKLNPINIGHIFDIVNNRDVDTYNALPDSIKAKVAESNFIGNYADIVGKRIPEAEQFIIGLDTDYNNRVKTTYQASYQRLKDTLASSNTTEEKITQLEDLLKTTNKLKNPTLTRQIKLDKQALEQSILDSKKVNEPSKESPEVNAAKVAKKTNQVRNPELPGITTTQLSPEEQAIIEELKQAEISKATMAGDKEEVGRLTGLTDEEWLLLSQNDEILASARAYNEEFKNLTPEEKEATIKGIPILTINEDDSISETEIDNTPSIDSLLDTEVTYQGKNFIVKKEGSKYILENDTLIIELEADSTSTIKSLNIEQNIKPVEVKKYNVKILNENEVNVNGTTYLVKVNSSGNIIGLNPTNRPDQTITNENLLVAVEIERNKIDFNTIVEDLVNNDQYEEIKDNHIELEFVEGIYGKNWNDRVSTALEKLYNNEELTDSERLAMDLWVTDALIELTKLYVKNPNLTYANALDNLEIINILLYDGKEQVEQRQNTPKTSTPKSTKKRTTKVTKPVESKLNKTPEVINEIPVAIEGSEPVITLGEDPVKEEISINESPKSPEVEVRDYNNETSIVNTTNLNNSEKVNDNTAQQHVKIVTPPSSVTNQNSINFRNWLQNGVSPNGQTVTFTLNPYNAKATLIFNKLKSGETVSKEDKQFMIDNLAINMNVDGVANTSTFLYVVRAKANMSTEEQAGVINERKLRTQIINNLLQDQPAQSTIVGQYGGDLKVTQDDVSITDIPDFKNGKVDDIPFMYVNGDGYLFDINSREVTTNPKFNGQKITLQATGKPMAGAIFTIVRKANGEQFPLKLNIAPLTVKEKNLVANLLKDIITPNSTGQNNILISTVPDGLLTELSTADKNYLSENGSKAITYSMVLNHLVYEGGRSTSNKVTQLLFKDGKIIFGDDVATLDNFFGKQAKLLDFLDKYKTRNVDLRKLSNDVKYKRHVINSGLLTINADTSGDTLFEAMDLAANYKNVSDRVTNRYKSASIYVKPELNSKAPSLNTNKEPIKELKPLEVNKEISIITGSIDTSKIDQQINAKLEENKEDMQLPKSNTPKNPLKGKKRSIRKESNKLQQAMDEVAKNACKKKK